MLRANAAGVMVLIVLAVTVSMPSTGKTVAMSPGMTGAGSNTEQNKFAGRWVSSLTRKNGQVDEVANDGVMNISESPTSAWQVNVYHSRRGGPYAAYTMQYPDRIEIQIPLGDGRVAHYNGVLVSEGAIKGQFFVTGDRQSQQKTRLRLLGDDDGNATWTRSQGGGT